MPTRLVDLDELLLSCRNESSKELIREAVLCYKAGAFRSAIVNTWIAVAFDLVEKLRELSLGGDKQAEVEVGHFEAIQASRNLEQALKFERELLTKCRDQFELISPLELIDLDRLAEDRNRCAHPNLVRYSEIYVPSAELVRTHLRNAIEHVLQQSPRVGKAALDQLFRDVQAEYFPTEIEGAKRVLLESPLGRAKTNVIREFALGITSRILQGDLGARDALKRIVALRAVFQIHREYMLQLTTTHFPQVFQKSSDSGLKYIVVILAHIPEISSGVSQGMEARINRCIEIGADKDLSLLIRGGLKVARFREVTMKRLAALDANGLSKVLAGGPSSIPEEVLERALDIFGQSGSWPIANSVGEKVIKPILDHLNKPQLLRLFKIGEENAEVLNSFFFIGILKDIKSGRVLTAGEFRSEMTRRDWDWALDEDDTDENIDSETLAT